MSALGTKASALREKTSHEKHRPSKSAGVTISGETIVDPFVREAVMKVEKKIKNNASSDIPRIAKSAAQDGKKKREKLLGNLNISMIEYAHM